MLKQTPKFLITELTQSSLNLEISTTKKNAHQLVVVININSNDNANIQTYQ
jgi:hypothetical protein